MSNQRICILPHDGKQYKVNLHTHSTVSDGKFTQEELKQLYTKHGYSAVAFTDHRNCVPHAQLTDESFVALTGLELDFGKMGNDGKPTSVVHINAIAKEPDTEYKCESMPFDPQLIDSTIKQLKNDFCFITVNHPVWSGMSTDDLLHFGGFDAIEVYNSVSVAFSNYSDDSAFYEYALRAGVHAVPVAADDCHFSSDGLPTAEYFKGFNMVIAKELSYTAITDALAHGACYASTGPLFEGIYIEGDILHVECSPASGVFAHGRHINCVSQKISDTDNITECELNVAHIRKASPYIWIQLRDTKGGKAWAMPYWFE